MTNNEEPVSEFDAKNPEFWPPRFDVLNNVLMALGFGCYDYDLCYYIINKGQCGIHKICSVHTDYFEASKALEAFDPVLRPHTEIRIGLLIEGQPVRVTTRSDIEQVYIDTRTASVVNDAQHCTSYEREVRSLVEKLAKHVPVEEMKDYLKGD